MATTFTTKILPLFRRRDIGCMAQRGILIGSADWMCDPAATNNYPDHGNARRVYTALTRGIMPPDGKWPQDRLDTFQKWMDEGFQS